MHNYEYENVEYGHTNGFIDLNGIPYLLAEYLDRNMFQQVDRSAIKSHIMVDQSESMRAVVDISVDDIGKRASDGYPAIIGNNTKLNNLIKITSDNRELMQHQFNVLRRGIVIRVDYRLENYRTRQVIRSMTESFRINDRNYFLDINPVNVNDNAIIVNFCNTMVSTINEFTHGQDPMMIRITNVHMSYEMVKPTSVKPRIKQSMSRYPDDVKYPDEYNMNNGNLYQYHDSMQNRHYLSGYDPISYNEDPSMIMPSSWSSFNRFYRFDNNARDIILHSQEINDNMTKVVLIPCGTVRINRTFMINPGHRIIFKFSIWKNDVTIVNDALPIAQAIGAQIDYRYGYNCEKYPINNPIHHSCEYNHDYKYEELDRKLDENRRINCQQNNAINKLTDSVTQLTEFIKNINTGNNSSKPDDEEENIEIKPIPPIICPGQSKPNIPSVKPPCKPPHHNNHSHSCAISHKELEDLIDQVDAEVDYIRDELDDIPDIKILSEEDIEYIISENDKLTDPNI